MISIKAVALSTALIAGLSQGAAAQDLVLHYSGTFSDDSTLGGLAFGDPTDFTYAAVFDSTTDTESENGAGIFPAVVTFNISGWGTFTSDAAGDVNVILFDPSEDQFGAFLGDRFTSRGFGGLFSTTTPGFDADEPSPSLLTGFLGPDGGLPYTIPLTGGAGDLVVNGATNGSTAQITLLPEPTSLAPLGVVGLLLVYSRPRPEGYAA